MDISTTLNIILVVVCIGLIIWFFLRKKETEHLIRHKDVEYENLAKRWDSAKENVTNLESQLATAKDKIENHQTELIIANSGIMNLHGQLTTARSEITNLESQLATAKGKIENHQIELIIANSGIMNLHSRLAITRSEITNLKTELTTIIGKRAEVSQSNANAVQQLHVSQISLQASAVAFHNERKKCEQLVKSYQGLEQMYNNLSETYNTTVEESKSKTKRRLVVSAAKTGVTVGASFIPGAGTVVEFGGQLIQFLMNAGEAAAESTEVLAAAQSLADVLANLENLGSISISMPDQDIDTISIALTEEGQHAFKAAFEQHLMDIEKLDPSNLTAFATDVHQQAGNLDSLKSLTEREHYERIYTIFKDFVDLGINYYDYHKAHKPQPAEKAPDLSIKV